MTLIPDSTESGSCQVGVAGNSDSVCEQLDAAEPIAPGKRVRTVASQ